MATHPKKDQPQTLNMMSKDQLKNIFRQTRHDNEAEKVTIFFDHDQATLKNWSRTGIGFELKVGQPVFELGAVVPNAALACGDIVLYEGPIEIKRVEKMSDGRISYGAAFAGGLFIIEGINAATIAIDCGNHIEYIGETLGTVKPEFCQSVLVLAGALRHIRRVCQNEETHWKKLNFDQRCEAERIFIPNVAHKIKSLFIHFNIKIATQVDVDTLPEGSPYHQIFHEEIYPFFEGADFIRRAFEKPRGYAGDYEMMNQIYRNGFEGTDLFGRVLHHYMTNENGPESVRFRKPFFIKHYQALLQNSGTQKVLAIACGPAVEFQEIIETWPNDDLKKIDVTLFDLDREALEHAQTKILDLSSKLKKTPNVNYLNANVKSFLSSASAMNSSYDLIYSGGLFDYLDNLTSKALLRKFFDLLRPGGTVITGNFTKDNLSKAFQHLLTNWTMFHKTEEEMRAWASDIEDCNVSMEYDPHRMNAFLVVKRDAS